MITHDQAVVALFYHGYSVGALADLLSRKSQPFSDMASWRRENMVETMIRADVRERRRHKKKVRR
jgi:hypothetical protein